MKTTEILTIDSFHFERDGNDLQIHVNAHLFLDLNYRKQVKRLMKIKTAHEKNLDV